MTVEPEVIRAVEYKWQDWYKYSRMFLRPGRGGKHFRPLTEFTEVISDINGVSLILYNFSKLLHKCLLCHLKDWPHNMSFVLLFYVVKYTDSHHL